MEEIIVKKITDELKPIFLEVKNNSYLHKGHMGDNGSNQTHFSIKINSDILNKLTLLNAHKLINKILINEFKNGLHAVEIKILKN